MSGYYHKLKTMNINELKYHYHNSDNNLQKEILKKIIKNKSAHNKSAHNKSTHIKSVHNKSAHIKSVHNKFDQPTNKFIKPINIDYSNNKLMERLNSEFDFRLNGEIDYNTIKPYSNN